MAWVAGVASIGAGAIGQEQQAQATISGARTNAAIEALNRAYQRKIFDENLAAQQPYYEAGVQALPMLEQFRTQGGIDLSQNPLYQMQQEQGTQALRDAGYTRPGTERYFNNALNATGQESAYRRLMDLQRVGLGAGESAGNYAMGTGNALASSYRAGGNALAQGYASAGNQRQRLYSDVAGQVGAMPAYFDYLRRTR